jgi:PHD/YefM family antitoxin component YafN of YafNO toxin-antitoxin module
MTIFRQIWQFLWRHCFLCFAKLSVLFLCFSGSVNLASVSQKKEYLIQHEIKGKRGTAVLLSESDGNAISETLHLVSVPGMRESIQERLNEKITECSKELDW